MSTQLIDLLCKDVPADNIGRALEKLEELMKSFELGLDPARTSQSDPFDDDPPPVQHASREYDEDASSTFDETDDQQSTSDEQQ